MERDKNMPEVKTIYISTTTAKFKITGWYRRDLEKPNWHYYEDIDGTLLHFRKEHLVAVIECPREERGDLK